MWTLLHGFTGSPRSYDPMLHCADLSDLPCIPALTGHGVDWRSRAIDSFEDEVSRLISFQSDITQPRFVCGYSLGARLALGMLAAKPNLFDGALLIGVHPGLTEQAARDERREIDSRRASLLREKGLACFVAAWEALPLFASQRALPPERLAVQRENRLAHDPEGLARSLEILGLAEMPDYAAAFASLEIPIVLMTGSLDSKFSKVATALAADNAHIEVQLVDGVGHNVLLEAPAVVAAALKRVEELARR